MTTPAPARPRAFRTAAQRWVAAVNHWGKLDQWAFRVCRDPQMLQYQLAAVLRRPGAAAQVVSQ